MKKILAAFFVCAFCLLAADFWQSKPYAEWSDKELWKMVTDSPWAYSFSVSGPGGGPVDNSAGPQGAGGRGGRGGGAPGGGPPGGGGLTVFARWQSALPVKQAFVQLKYGAQAATSPEAKRTLEHVETSYVIVLSGPFRPLMTGDRETLKKTMMDMSSLSVKGKDAVKPADIHIELGQNSNDIIFFFPRSDLFTADDKEVEFSTKLGDATLKHKFKLKDMVFNGKLEM
jgi:hypothetical protein